MGLGMSYSCPALVEFWFGGEVHRDKVSALTEGSLVEAGTATGEEGFLVRIRDEAMEEVGRKAWWGLGRQLGGWEAGEWGPSSSHSRVRI